MDKLEVITPQGRNGGEVILWGLGEEFKGKDGRRERLKNWVLQI